MKRKLWILIFVPFILSLLIGSASCDTQTVYPSDDVYVNKHYPDTNWDTDWMHVRNHTDFEFRPWLKFTVPSGLTIQKAELFIYLNYLAFPEYMNITVHGSANTTWTEETITWNDQPDYDATIIDSLIISGDETWCSWTVTSNVTSGSISSFCAIAVTYYPNAQFLDKEDGSNSPYLKLTVPEGEGEEFDINIMNVPLLMGQKLGITTWSAGMLLSALFLFPVNMILMFWKKGGIGALIFNFAMLGIFASIQWLPVWTVILVAVLVIAVQGLKMKDVI